MRAVISESADQSNREISVFSPRVTRTSENADIAKLQHEWTRPSVRVKVLTADRDGNIRAAAELARIGVHVRLLDAEQIDIDSLSYHVFVRDSEIRLVLNEKRQGRGKMRDTVGFFDSAAVASDYLDRFESDWSRSHAVGRAITQRVLQLLESPGVTAEEGVEKVCRAYKLSDELRDDLRLRVALAHVAHVVLVVGPPGAGKSTVRSELTRWLNERNIDVVSASDYPFLYELFLRDQLLSGARRFRAHRYGGFEIVETAVFDDALRALESRVLRPLEAPDVAAVEFARPDLAGSLRLLDAQVRERSHLIYVDAPIETRLERLRARHREPSFQTSENSVALTVADEHYMPSVALEQLYSVADPLPLLKKDPQWSTRISIFENTGALDEASSWVDNDLESRVRSFWDKHSRPRNLQN